MYATFLTRFEQQKAEVSRAKCRMYEYHENQARQCLLKATLTKNEVEHQNWLALADAWLTLSNYERKAQREMGLARNEADALVQESLAQIKHSSMTAQILEWPLR
jgi:hypothetical protein